MRPGCLLGSPPGEVAATTWPCRSSATQPTVSWALAYSEASRTLAIISRGSPRSIPRELAKRSAPSEPRKAGLSGRRAAASEKKGRALCRDRECQYVSLSVGDEALKKKNNRKHTEYQQKHK